MTYMRFAEGVGSTGISRCIWDIECGISIHAFSSSHDIIPFLGFAGWSSKELQDVLKNRRLGDLFTDAVFDYIHHTPRGTFCPSHFLTSQFCLNRPLAPLLICSNGFAQSVPSPSPSNRVWLSGDRCQDCRLLKILSLSTQIIDPKLKIGFYVNSCVAFCRSITRFHLSARVRLRSMMRMTKELFTFTTTPATF